MSAGPWFVIGLGASTPVGRNAWSSAAAVRAGVSGFIEHPYMLDTQGEPMRVAAAPWLDIGLAGADRLAALLWPAIAQALEAIDKARRGALRIGLSLALPAPRPGLADDAPASLLAALRAHQGQAFAAMAAFPHDHAAGHLALAAAMRELDSGKLDACVVAGVDSYLAPETLEWLEENDRLHGAGELNNAWGIIPGEGAAALLVAGATVPRSPRSRSAARLLGVGTAFETRTVAARAVNTGEGLAWALRDALRHLPGGVRVSDVYCDLNGEPHRADEYGFAALRAGSWVESASDFTAPADCWGDVAAASAPLHLMLAAVAGAKAYARGHVACAWASSDGGERGATLLATDGRA
ncbi:beta-ketoacyl synthase N-terminal-like domain-containing protein [Pseudoduganella namucuonensis]|uniref:3-oxoacyl-[acyl-carrier-protein] synthase-1 n=1 Tax=Pseudoduganella namucuonensis TaxID=1035707 RepID=A0A1I7KPU7_9BURK|nr:beta-ketoacyl synthase N-terminal-like domain-containing protein [Pseudoduganella namucuonensis]SFU99439.1 3-oxoacyl-[acyl-carrier-protein] synthase-1 [Pseudoduganella namucuonensis]